MSDQIRIGFVGIDEARAADFSRALGGAFHVARLAGEHAFDAVAGGTVAVCVVNAADAGSRAVELTKAAKSSGRTEVIVLADSISRPVAQDAVAAGAFCFLQYPVDSDVLAKLAVRAAEAAVRPAATAANAAAAVGGGNGGDPSRSNGFQPPAGLTLEQIERATIYHALKRTRGNKQAAANALGIYRPRLYSKIKKYNMTEFM